MRQKTPIPTAGVFPHLWDTLICLEQQAAQLVPEYMIKKHIPHSLSCPSISPTQPLPKAQITNIQTDRPISSRANLNPRIIFFYLDKHFRISINQNVLTYLNSPKERFMPPLCPARLNTLPSYFLT